MKTFIKSFSLFLVILFISIIWTKQANAQNSISGHVRYSDNNELLTGGHVKVYNTNGNLIAIQPINSQGEFYVSNLEPIMTDIIAVAPDAEEDFPPTYFPDAQDPSLSTPIMALGIVQNRDIFVERIINPPAQNVSSVSGRVNAN